MAIVEESFPRGGKVKETKSNAVLKIKKLQKPENLFKAADKKKPKKRSLKKKKVAKKSEEKSLTAREKKNIEKEKTALESIEPLAYKVLVEGMHVLGRIQEIREMDVILSLPGRIQAVVPITNISTPYSKLLDRLAQDEDIEVASMSTFLSVGDIFPCTIKEVTNDGSFKVTASLNPADLCSDIPLTGLGKGMKMVAAVQSVEDHGYVMDIGMASVRSFLKKEPNMELSEGAILNVCVTNCQIDGHVATLTLSTAETVKFKQNVDMNIATILPGTKLSADVKKVTPQGLIVSVGNLLGYIHKDHLASASTVLSSYEDTSKSLTVVALYTLPIVNAIYLSLKTSLIDPKKAPEKQAMDIGRILDATIIETTNAGLFVQLNKSWRGFVPLRHLSDSKDIVDDIKAHFQVKSRKKCRIVGFSSLDEIYICTMKKSLLEQKHLRYEDYQIGELVEGKIESVSPAGVAVQLGVGLKGFIPKLHWADDPRLKRPELRFKIGETIKGRVLKVNAAKKNVHLTSKRTLVESTEPAHSQASDLTRGLQLKGTVTLIEKGGVLVTFFGDLTGYMPRDFVKARGVSDMARYFYVGQLIDCVIANITDSGKVTVNLPREPTSDKPNEPKQEKANKAKETKKIKETKETPAGCKPAGTIVTCKVTKIFDAEQEASKGLEVSVAGLKSNAFVPVEHLTDFAPLAGHLFKCYSVGDVIKDAVVWSSSELQTILTLKPGIVQFAKDNRFPKSFDELQVNATYPVVSAKHRDFGVFATLLSPPGCLEPLFPVSKLPPAVFKHCKTGRDVSLEGKVISIDAEKRRITLSGLDEDLDETSADLLDNYMQHLEKIRSHYASNAGDEQLKALANLKIGDPVVGKLDAAADASNDLVFQLSSGLRAVVPHYHRGKKKFGKGDIVAGAVLHCDLIERLVYVTVRDDVIGHITRLSPTGVTGTRVKSTILLKTDFFSLVSTNKENVRNYAYVSNIRNVNEACTKIVPPFKVGDTTFIDVVESTSGRVAVYHKKPKKWEAKKRPAQSESDAPESKKAKSGDGDELKQKQQQKKENSHQKTVNEDNETTQALDDGTKKAKKQSKKEKAAAAAAVAAKSVTASDEPDENAHEASPSKKRRVETTTTTANILRSADALTLPRLAVSAFKWDDDYATLPLATNATASSDSEDDADADDEPGKKKKKEKTSVKDRRERAKQKLEEAKREEARLSKIEEELNDPNRAPAAADDFDRMVLSSPNSSILWLQYMAFHLGNAEIEKARTVAQRALKTINFREEQEKFNVWIGLLNLEHMYGTSEVYEETFQEALRCNEPFKIYRQLALNFEQSGKVDEAESLHRTMMKKFKQDKSVWLNAFVFYVRNGQLDTARTVFQRAKDIVDKRQQIDLISRFAQLEVKFGEIERGKTLFDKMLMEYPKRTDLWLVYVDTLTKAGDLESARQVLERCITLQLPAKKMKTIFQKFLEFESQHGSDERKDYVRQKALEYVESKSSNVDEAD